MKKILITLTTLIVMNLPISCIQDDCGGAPLESRIAELTTAIGSYSSAGFSTTTSSNYQQAAVQLQITDIEYLRTAYNPSSYRFSFISQAHACDPVLPDPLQQITAIEITANESVFANGSEFKAGTSLNALFHVANRNQVNIEGFLELQNASPDVFGELSDEIILMLKNVPDSSFNLKLQVKFVFNVGESFQLETDFLKIAM